MRVSYLVGIGSVAVIVAAGIVASVDATPSRSQLPDVQLASAGFVDLATEDGAPVAALHVRVAIDNRGDAVPWRFDASAARIDGAIAPMLASSDLATLPITIVSRGEHATVDVYFPVAPDTRAFDAIIPVAAGKRELAKRVHFVASAAAPTVALGEARTWWGAPDYPWPAFRYQDGVITPRPPARARVTHVPAHGFMAE